MGIKITGLFTTDGGEYPLVEDIHLLGGYRALQTLADRDNIPELRRKWGMLVYVVETGKYYILLDINGDNDLTNNNNWVIAEFSGGSSYTYYKETFDITLDIIAQGYIELSNVPSDNNQIFVLLNGLVETEGSFYNVNGNRIEFIDAINDLTVNDKIEVRYAM